MMLSMVSSLSWRDAVVHPWEWEPGIVAPLAASAVLYALGSRRLRATDEAALGSWNQRAFWGGWLTLVVALVSPVHPISEQLFWVHMVQHELLMTLAAPLLVVGRPLLVCLRALPERKQESLERAWHSTVIRRGWGVLTRPLDAWLLHGAIIWVWHAPALFDAALRSDAVHALQHIAFLGTALLFWEALLYRRSHAAAAGMGIVYLFTTGVHTGALGALMTFAHAPWYPTYAQRAAAWGLSPMQDQQLAGLIMWVPGSVAYLVAALSLAARWLRESDAMADTASAGVIAT